MRNIRKSEGSPVVLMGNAHLCLEVRVDEEGKIRVNARAVGCGADDGEIAGMIRGHIRSLPRLQSEEQSA